MTEKEIKIRIKQAFWDVNYTADDLYDVLMKKKDVVAYMTRERMYIRLMETYSWYKLLEFIPRDQLAEMLTEKIIKSLRAEPLRKRYDHVARILRETALPTSR